jgi:hypothetical protein
MALQIFGLLQLVVVAQQVLVFQINGGVQVAVVVKSHRKLFQLTQETYYQFQLVPVVQLEMGPQLHLDPLLPAVEKPH